MFSELITAINAWTVRQQQPSETEILTQWAPLIQAGLGATESIQLLADTAPHPSTRDGFLRLKQGLSNGFRLDAALRHSGLPFSNGVIVCLASAETSGRLGDMLSLTATRLNQMHQMRQKAWSAARYPLIVAALAGVIIVGLIVGIVPRFEALYARMGSDLPLATQLLIGVSDVLRAHSLLTLMSLIGFGLCLGFLARLDGLQRGWDHFLSHLPLIGRFRRDLQGHHLTTQMDVLTRSGIRLDSALKTVSQTVSSHALKDALLSASHDIQRGHRADQVFERLPIDPQSRQLWALGVRAGRLSHFMGIAHHTLDARLKTQLESLTGLLEPLLMALLGILTGGVMMALYEPVFSLGDAL